jgi:hypothetical protein
MKKDRFDEEVEKGLKSGEYGGWVEEYPEVQAQRLRDAYRERRDSTYCNCGAFGCRGCKYKR